MAYFHCDPSNQNENERKGKREKKLIYIHTPVGTQTYIHRYTYAHIHVIYYSSQIVHMCELISISGNPNGHIFIDLPRIRRRNSTRKVRGNYIDFERRIHVGIVTLIRRGYFDVDSNFKIDEISMSSPRGFFYVVSTSNRCNFCTRCFHSIIF